MVGHYSTMSAGSFATLAKNVKQLPAGLVATASSIGPGFAALQKFRNRQWDAAPQDHKDQAEEWETGYYKRHLCQHKNMWVDKDLHTVMSRQDVASIMRWKSDTWKLASVGTPFLLTGGFAAPLLPIWLANDTWQPSTMATTPEAVAEWRKAQDLQRYKHIPASITSYKWWLESTATLTEPQWRPWEELFEKNDVRRDPKCVEGVSQWYERFQPFYRIRRQQARQLGRAMGIPSFPNFGKICLQRRVLDHWELAWNEDMIVMQTNALESMSDEELYDYAWRRYLAPYDKNLNREQLLERVNDYYTALGPNFKTEGKVNNIFTVITYCFGYYNEPAFLENDISELEANDFEGLSQFGKDLFMQRLEFENGPLRDQVEAHSQKKLKEREEKLAALEAEP